MPEFTEILKLSGIIALIGAGGFILSHLSLKGINILGARAGIPALVMHPLKTIIKLFVIVLTLSLILGQFGIELMGLVTATFALIAIGFIAVWSIMSNVTSTIFLAIIKPFNLNDYLEIANENIAGKVVDMNLFFTTLENDKGEFFQIPNNLLFQKVIKRRKGKEGKTIELDEHLDATAKPESSQTRQIDPTPSKESDSSSGD